MEVAAGIIAALLGVFLGRALNSSIDRLPPARENNRGRCGGRHIFRPLSWRGVVYIWWHPSCNLCRQKIPLRAVAVEGITAIACGGLVYWYGFSLASLILIFYAALFVHLPSSTWNTPIAQRGGAAGHSRGPGPFPLYPLGARLGIAEAYLWGLTGSGAGFRHDAGHIPGYARGDRSRRRKAGRPPWRDVGLPPNSSRTGVRDCHEIISSIEQRNAG